jgi:SAM-dependent methyltransferase
VAEPGNLAAEPATRPTGQERCLLCNGATAVRYPLPHLWHQPVGSRSYEIRWCNSCDFGFLDPRPSPLDLARFQADSRELSRAIREKDSTRTSFAERVRVRIAWQAAVGWGYNPIAGPLIHEVAGSRPGSICIFGPTADLIKDLAAAGHEIAAATSDADETATLRSQGATVFEGTLESGCASQSARAFDVVVCRETLERCVDPGLGMEQARRLLKPGGHLMVQLPNHRSCTARRLGPAWFHCDAGNAVNFFTSQSLSRLATARGFGVVGNVHSEYVTQFRNSRTFFEQSLWDRLYRDLDRNALPRPTRTSSWERWRLLATSMFRRADEKFEFTGMIARKPVD